MVITVLIPLKFCDVFIWLATVIFYRVASYICLSHPYVLESKEVYFHVAEHIYLAYFNEELVALDLKKDQYVILPSKIAKVIDIALSSRFKLVKNQYMLCDKKQLQLPKNFQKSIEFLRELGILSYKDYNCLYPKQLNKNISVAGADNIDWRMSFGDLSKKVPIITVMEAYFFLINVYVITKLFGFYGLIKSIKKRKIFAPITRNSPDFDVLVTALNRACFYFPVRIKCLEWSAALTFMGLRRKWRCNMEIGIQNLPFKAHAWVKSNDQVIADAPDLPQSLSVILSEPY